MEEQKKDGRYFKCLLAIESADANGDNRILKDEFHPFVETLRSLVFGDDPVADGEFPSNIDNLYKSLAAASGAPEGDNEINVFGAEVLEVHAMLARLHFVL
jgi:hypothetical protein